MEVGNEMEIFIVLTKYNTHQQREEASEDYLSIFLPPHNSVQRIYDWLVGFYGISTFVGYLTLNPFLCK